MAFWAQLLPGLRDVRVPMSVGALWLATGYLLWDRLPAALRDGPFVHNIESLAKAAPGAAVASAATFSVYLLGIILNQIGSTVFNKVITPLVNGAGWLILAAAVVLVIVHSWPAIALGVIIFIVVAYLAWRRDQEVPFAEHAEGLYNSLAIRSALVVSDAWNAIANAWNPSRGNVEYIVKREIERMLAESPRLIEDHISRIPSRRIAQIFRLLRLTSKDIRRAAPDLSPGLGGKSSAKQLQMIRSSEELTAAARRAIQHAVMKYPAKMEKLLEASLDKRKLRNDIRGRVDRANVRLKADHEGVYGEYDRLRSESELRLAVVAPLFALLATAGVRIAEDLQASNEGVYGAYAIAGALALLMMMSGHEKESEAADLLYSALRQELVENHDQVAYGEDFFPIRAFPEGDLLTSPLAAEWLPFWQRRTNKSGAAKSSGASEVGPSTEAAEHGAGLAQDPRPSTPTPEQTGATGN